MQPTDKAIKGKRQIDIAFKFVMAYPILPLIAFILNCISVSLKPTPEFLGTVHLLTLDNSSPLPLFTFATIVIFTLGAIIHIFVMTPLAVVGLSKITPDDSLPAYKALAVVALAFLIPFVFLSADPLLRTFAK